jgi:hypothetical protein
VQVPGLRVAVLVLAIVLVTAGGAPSAEGAKRKKSCRAAHSHTIASNRYVRLFSKANHESGRNVYACLRGSGKRELITRSFDDGYVASGEYSNVGLAGRFVAWFESQTDISCKAACPPNYQATTEYIGLCNLRSGRCRQVDGEVTGHALVLTRRGALAWAQDGTEEVEIHASDRAGERILDSGNIRPASLKVRGLVVSWTKDGQARSATLN